MANVLVLVSYKIFPPLLGGQKTVVGLYDQLSIHHDISLALSNDNDINGKGFWEKQCLYPNKKMHWNAAKLFALKQICSDRKIDCVIAEHSYSGWIAYLLKKLTGIPFIIRSHNIESSRFQQMGRAYWRLYQRYEKWIHKKADHSFFISADDEQHALHQFGLSQDNCSVVPYGISNIKKIEGAKEKLREKYGVASKYIFYFNGTLDYRPNTEAVLHLVERLNPILQSMELDYTILISGANMPADLQTKIKDVGNMTYLGYVEEVELLYQSATVFLNPVVNNSGVKTKVLEALANNCPVVSMVDGAHGIPDELYGKKMLKAKNSDWNDFVEKILVMINSPSIDTPGAFFDYFSSEKIAQRAADKINSLVYANA